MTLLSPAQSIVQSNATLTTSGSATFLGYSAKTVYLVINITNTPTGTLPTLKYTLQEVDSGNGATNIGTSVISKAYNSVTTDVVQFNAFNTGVIKVSWAVTGTTPSFSGVYATLLTRPTQPISAKDPGGNEVSLLADGYGNLITVGAGTAGAPSGGVVSVQGVSGGQALPVSGTLTSSQTGVWTVRNQDGYGVPLTALTGAPVGTETGLVTRNLPAGIQPVSQSGSWTVTAQQSNAFSLQSAVTGFYADNSGNVTTKVSVLPARANTAAPTWTDGYQEPLSVDTSGFLRTVNNSIGLDGSAVPTSSTLAGGVDGGAILRALSTDSNGILYQSTIVQACLQGRISGAQGGRIYGQVTTAATTEAAVRLTTYTEQASNAQRSVVSSSVLDTSAGTGARTVRITYYSQTGTGTLTGPFTEDVTTNGLTAVNTVSTTIRYIESLEVITAGSGGVNAGTISLTVSTGGLGGTIASIAVGARNTNYAQHYVASGRTAYVTDVSAQSGAGSGKNPKFIGRYLDLGTAAAAERIAFDVVANGASPTIQKMFGVPIKVPGPARIVLYVDPADGASQAQNADFDYFEY